MKPEKQKLLSLDKLNSLKRQPVRVSQKDLVETGYVDSDKKLPLVVYPALENINLAAWARCNLTLIEDQLTVHGAILFRGFNVRSGEKLEEFIHATSEKALEYAEQSSPRTRVSGNIYTSTDHPPSESIFLHNEQSYNYNFPQRIYFFCLQAAQQGGETPLADTRKIFQRIDPRIRARFIERHYAYARNFGDGFGLAWQTAFQTSRKSVVENYCRDNDISFEWRPGDRLRTSQVRRVVARHPQSSVPVWFNHLTFFHISTLPPHTRDRLLEQFEEEDLPNNTYYGDGSRIDSSVMDALREAYLQERVSFEWREGDVLMVDNMLTSHGRNPYVGPRKVLVGMTNLRNWKDV